MGNLPRLQKVKRKYDPRNFLSNGQGIISVSAEKDSTNNDVPSVACDSGAMTPTEAGWIGGVVGLVVGVALGLAGAVIIFGRGRSTPGRQMTSKDVGMVGKRRTTNEQKNPARQSIVDAMDKNGNEPLA